VRVKICGITRPEDAEVAANLGAHYIGFIFVRRSPRYIEPQRASEIVGELPKRVIPVGVFVDEERDRILDVVSASGIKAIQLHGAESPEFCASFGSFPVIKAFRVRPPFGIDDVEGYRAGMYLLDTFHPTQAGGTGHTFDWTLAEPIAREARVMLAGGLDARNVVRAVESVRPFAVDTSSGVEATPGIKDPARMVEFFGALENAGKLARKEDR